MKHVNSSLLDKAIHHQVNTTQYANGLVRKLIALLNRVDIELGNALTAALETMTASSFTVQRLDNMLLTVRLLNAAVYDRFTQGLDTDLRSFTTAELGFQGSLLDVSIPGVVIPLTAVAPEVAYAAVLARPFQGRLLSEWAKSIADDRMLRIRDTVRMGFVQGKTNADIVKSIRGTAAKNYSDGIIEVDRRNAEAVVRTAVAHTAAVARDAMYAANADLVKAVQWVSTLDGRTTHICMTRDGLEYDAETHKPLGHSVPWLGGPGQAHWNCRSCSVPVLKSWAELGIDMEDMIPATRASMDGQVAASTTYAEWFAKQSAARQDEIVGPTRGKLFRSGSADFSKFTNDKGRWLTLAELQARDGVL